MDYGMVMIDGWWRAVPVGGAQWQVGEWRAKVGRGQRGAALAADRARIANERKRNHPTRQERRMYTDFVDVAVLQNTQLGTSRHPNNPRKDSRMTEVTQKRPLQQVGTRRHPDWSSQGGTKNTRITGNLHQQCKEYALHYNCTVEYAVNYFLQRGLQSIPPQQHDSLQPGGAE